MSKIYKGTEKIDKQKAGAGITTSIVVSQKMNNQTRLQKKD